MGQARRKEAARQRIASPGGACPAEEIPILLRMTAPPAGPERASAPITFPPARFADVEDEIAPLWRAHWLEIGEDRERVPLDPDWDKYGRLDALGMLEITAARRGADLVGYLFSVVDTHLHYRGTLCAAQDLRYLRPDARGPRVALRLGQAHKAQLRARGVVKAIANVKVRADRDGRLFAAMGWRPFETIYATTL